MCRIVYCFFSTLDNTCCSRRLGPDMRLNQINAGQGIVNNEWCFSKQIYFTVKNLFSSKDYASLTAFSIATCMQCSVCGTNRCISSAAGAAGVLWLRSSWSLWFFIAKGTCWQLPVHSTSFISFLWWCISTVCCSLALWENFQCVIHFSQASVNLLGHVKSEFINWSVRAQKACFTWREHLT